MGSISIDGQECSTQDSVMTASWIGTLRFRCSRNVLVNFQTDAKAAMSAKIESKNDRMLHQAALSGDCQTIRRLLDSGKVFVDCADEDGTTALMLASSNGHLDCVKELINEGAELLTQRQTGTHALFFSAQGGHWECTRYLIDHGAPINLVSNDGATALFVAAQCGHLPIAELLVKNGAAVDLIMQDGATALFVAAQNGHLPLVRFLISKGVDINQRRHDGANALWIASQTGSVSVVHELLKRGAEVDSARMDGATPLFKAAHKGHYAVCEELLRKHPNLGNLKNGESPLHAAALFGHLPIVKLLIQHGAYPMLRNKAGETPLDLAKQMGYDHISDYLEAFKSIETEV